MNPRHPLVSCRCGAIVLWCTCRDEHATRRVIVACDQCNGRQAGGPTTNEPAQRPG